MAKGVRTMVGPSKILTVSYGTFSCTLEGFDDPFSTMKAIAEYFRDLAADDRYFGAEPPVPDAAMLHRIAEREIQRRVEARVQEGGVVLRAAEPAAEPAGATPAAAPAATVPAAPAAVPRLRAATPSIEESVAAKLARIRAAVDRARVVPPAVAEIEDAVEVAPPVSAPAAAAAPAADAAPQGAGAAEPAAGDAATVEPDTRATAHAAGDEAPDAAPEEEAPEPLAGFDADAEVARLIPPAAAATAGTEAGDPDLDALIGRIAAAPAAGASPAEPAEAPEPAAEAEAAEVPAATAAARPAAEPGAAPVAPVRARVIKVRRIERSSPPSALLSPEDEDDLARELAAVEREMGLSGPDRATGAAAPDPSPASRSAATEEPSAPAAVPAKAAVAPPPARPAPRPEAEDAAVSRLIARTNTAMEGAENRRRAATIAHLKAAVAATVADRAAGAARVDPSQGREEAYREDLAEAVRPRRPETVPGSGRRRPDPGNRIPPLVLVSAQRVDRPAARPAEVGPVRPRRVTSGSLALTRALDADPGGDVDETAQGEGGANIFAAPNCFAEVVARLGAGQLPELIESAAAYITVFEGRESFTRPQLVRLAASVSREAVGREDGLRAFGVLLRQGRIDKARRGQFALAEGNRMLAEMRKLSD
jgi:hypothetical protein